MALAAKSHLEMSVACTNCGIQGSKTLKLTGGLDAAKRWQVRLVERLVGPQLSRFSFSRRASSAGEGSCTPPTVAVCTSPSRT